MTFPEILSHFEAATGHRPVRSGSGYETLCPAHDDKTPSLTLREGDDGRTLYCCQRGCTFEAVASALNLKASDFFDGDRADPEPAWDPKRDGFDETAVHVFHDEDGSVSFEKVRREPRVGHPMRGKSKSFTQRRDDPERPGRKLYNLKGVTRELYRLPRVREAVSAGRLVFVVEGEKDADRLESLGLVATTNDGGAGKWRSIHTARLEGAHVVVIADNDAAGRAHARDVCRALQGVAASVLVLTLATLPDGSPMPVKGDVSDWLDAGGAVDELKAMVQVAPSFADSPLARDDDAEDSTPSHATIPERVYTLSPPPIADACGRFKRWAERDAFLTSLLVVLSGALPHVRFRYGRHYLSPHLFAILYGAAASGKGVVTLARAWLHGIDDALTRASTAVREAWTAKKAERDRMRRSRKKADQDEIKLLDETDPLGPEPPSRYLLMGEDTTSAGLVDAVHDNPEGVALVSTEADTLTDANGKEHGRFSSVMRKAFHNERHAENRRSGGRLVVAAVRLAVLLAGTLDQVGRLFEKGVEDGLFSRFIFYGLGGSLRYESQREISVDREFDLMTEARAADAQAIHEALSARDVGADGDTAPLYVDLPPEAWGRMDEAYRSLFERMYGDGASHPALAANVKRGPVICYRIATVLAVWRAYGAGVDLRTARSLTIGDEDAEAALLLSLVYVETALRHAERFSQKYRAAQAFDGEGAPGGAHRTTAEDRNLLDLLPDEFDPTALEAAALALGVSRATAFRRAKAWVKAEHVTREKDGRRTVYRKATRPTPGPYVGDGVASAVPAMDFPDLDVPEWGGPLGEPPF